MYSRRTPRPLLAALAVLVLATLTLLVPARSARAEPSLSVEPGTAKPGESVRLAGTDCDVGGEAQAVLNDSDGEPVAAEIAYQPNDEGSWSGEYDVPLGLLRGDYTFVADCRDADGDVSFGYPDRQLKVNGAVPIPTPTPTATATVEPSPSPSLSPTASDPPSPEPTEPGPSQTPTQPGTSLASPPPVDGLQQEADSVVAALEDGSLAFHPPRSMSEGVSEEVVIQVSRPSVPGDPGDAVPGDGPVVVVPVEVSTSMTAELSGSDFTVDPPGAQRRILTSTRPAEWRWTVTPKSFGTTELRLRLAVVLNEDPTTPLIPQVTYDEPITVHVHPLHTAVRLAKSVQGALTALGLSAAAVVAAAVHLLRRRRRAAPPEPVASESPGPDAPEPPVSAKAPIPDQRRRLGRRSQRVAGRPRR